MPHEYISDDAITSQAAFEAALTQLLGAALGNDVDPRGAWVVDAADHSSKLEVMVFTLSADATTE